MGINKKFLLLSLLTITFVMNISGITNARILGEELFFFEIIGNMGYEGMVGVPYPPTFNYSASEIPEADTYGYGGLIFRISYQGNNCCQISRILLWQELIYFGCIYNYSGLNEIPSPGIFYLKGQEYEFIVKSEGWPPRFLINSLIRVRIYTENERDFLLSSKLTFGIEKLENWNPKLRLEFGNSFVNLLPLIVGIIIGLNMRRK